MKEHFHRIWNKFTSLKSNLQVLEDWTADLAEVGKIEASLLKTLEENPTLHTHLPSQTHERLKALDLAFLTEDLPSLIQESVKCMEILRDDLMQLHRDVDSTLSVSVATRTAETTKS